GDALGNPVEFLSTLRIRQAYGETGVTEPVLDPERGVAVVTDDTQMTLFTAEGLIRAHARYTSRGIGGAETAIVRNAYRRWRDTKNPPGPPVRREGRDLVRGGWLREQPWLYVRRAPGNACLSGLESGRDPGADAGVA